MSCGFSLDVEVDRVASSGAGVSASCSPGCARRGRRSAKARTMPAVIVAAPTRKARW